MQQLHGKFVGLGTFIVFQPVNLNSVALLLDTGATTRAAGLMWRTRLKILPGVAISALAVGHSDRIYAAVRLH